MGIASIVGSSSNSSSGSSGGVLIGMGMVILSLFVQSSQMVYEEMLFTKYELPAQRMVGIEGLFGMVFLFMWMMIFTFIKCPNSEMCDIRGYFEDPVAGIHQLLHTPMLLFWSCVTIVSIMFFNNYGLVLTKTVSSVFRAFWDASRTVLVWVDAVYQGCQPHCRT